MMWIHPNARYCWLSSVNFVTFPKTVYLLNASGRLVPILMKNLKIPLREKCPYSEFFWFAFSRIWTEYEEILQIRTLFTQCIIFRKLGYEIKETILTKLFYATGLFLYILKTSENQKLNSGVKKKKQVKWNDSKQKSSMLMLGLS